MMNIAIAIGCAVLIIFGTLGAVLPFIPGIPLALAGLWVYAVYSHFQVVSIWAVLIFTAFAIVVEVLNIFAPALGAKGVKSSTWGAAGALIGGIAGVALLGPIGVVIGPFIGGLVGEM